MKKVIFNYKRISEKCDPRLGTLVRSETQDPGPISQVGPGTRDLGPLRWDPRSETGDPTPLWDPVFDTRDPIGGTEDPRQGTLKVNFLKIVSVFSDAPRLWSNSCALCVYVGFVCVSLPCHKAYTPLIF